MPRQRLPGPATLQDHSRPEGKIPRAMRAFTSGGALSPVFRFALAEASGECSPWQETEGADGRSGLCATATCQYRTARGRSAPAPPARRGGQREHETGPGPRPESRADQRDEVPAPEEANVAPAKRAQAPRWRRPGRYAGESPNVAARA